VQQRQQQHAVQSSMSLGGRLQCTAKDLEAYFTPVVAVDRCHFAPSGQDADGTGVATRSITLAVLEAGVLLHVALQNQAAYH
jgi:hypothetical protein